MKRSGSGDEVAAQCELNPTVFRRRLMKWYGERARALPWRETSDPYRIWVAEVMLQQTRVAAVVDYYNDFLRRFPTLVSLALASELEVLVAWSGLGYYNRARMLHKAAQFIVTERRSSLPSSAAELRTLPGIGEYTAAAIASIAFGESVAVVDGNVERVILRLTGRASENTAAARGFVRDQAQALVPQARGTVWRRDGQSGGGSASGTDTSHFDNPAGDHNQAMMELGAMVCLPRAPLCGECPVRELCRTRGEHPTPARAPQRSQPVACLLDLRKRGPATEVLLERRPEDAAVMPAMVELPPLPLDAVEGLEPALRIRHTITNTNYYVQVFSPRRLVSASSGSPASTGKRAGVAAQALRSAIPADSRELQWTRTTSLASLPLTGLTRKILLRLKLMEKHRAELPE